MEAGNLYEGVITDSWLAGVQMIRFSSVSIAAGPSALDRFVRILKLG